MRLDHQLQQTYIVRLIEQKASGESEVLDVPLDIRNRRPPVQFRRRESATLVVSGSTEGTTVTAPYHVELRLP